MINATFHEEILTGGKFAEALCSGIHRVILEQDFLNRINVFPVADGDTGTNLSLSLGAALNTLTITAGKRLDSMLADTADALLDGARGNSGAIMAQFFQGLSDAAVGQHQFTLVAFADALTLASTYAHDAIAKPLKGTILSVIAAYSGSVYEQAYAQNKKSFSGVLERALGTAKQALIETEMQLEVLRKAGVVDAGAKGFVVMLEGFSEFLLHGRVTAKPEFKGLLTESWARAVEDSGADSQYQYCTECMIGGQQIDRRKLREELSEIGDSLVLAGTKRKAKIHIHVNQPDVVFEIGRRYGTLSGQKADDMRRQIETRQASRANFGVITDSAADIPEADMERLDIHMVPCRIQIGERGYLDKVSISPEEMFVELQKNNSTVSSSQPTPGDFRRQYQYLASHYRDVISVNLTNTVSGTLQAAQAAAERVTASGKVHVVNSLNASVGQGLLAVFAAECAAAGLSTERTLHALGEMRGLTRSFVLVKDLSYAVRGGRVSAYVKRIADGLFLTPLLGVTADGRIRMCGILPGRKRLLPRFAKFVARRTRKLARVRISIGHALCENDAKILAETLDQHLPVVCPTAITELGSAFGVHGGPGTILVGVQAYREPDEFR